MFQFSTGNNLITQIATKRAGSSERFDKGRGGKEGKEITGRRK
jgi:hypothetical protein